VATPAGGPVRVLHVITHFSDAGGAEVSLVQSLPWLQDAGLHNAVQPISAKSSRHRADLERRGVVVFPPAGDRLTGQVTAVRRAIREFCPDVVHTSMWDADQAGRIAARLERVPAIAGLISAPYSALAYSVARRPRVLRAYQGLDSILGRYATSAFHALSRYTADEGIRALRIDSRRVFVVPRGRDRELLGEPGAERRASARAGLGIEPDRFVVVNTARHEPAKRVDHLIRAFATVVHRYPLALLLQAGREGAGTQGVHAEIEAGDLAGNVRLLGRRADVPDLLAASDVFAFTSMYEGLPGSVIEAMAMALPVVAYDIQPVLEAMGDSGVPVPRGEADEFGRVLTDVLGNSVKRSELGAAARVRFESNYLMPVVAARMAEMYRVVAQR
jgi:glycosyltransferase involved in cell wall biosynthesis